MRVRCKLCDWVSAHTGTYAGHRLLRDHVRSVHPTDFAVLKAGEERMEQIRGQLCAQFGLALTPRNMNPEN